MNYEQLVSMAETEWTAFDSGDSARVLIGMGTCGQAAGAAEVTAAAKDALEKLAVDAPVRETGCIGLCYAEPLVELQAPGGKRVLYGNIQPDSVPGLIEDFYRKQNLRADLALGIMNGPPADGIPAFSELPMIAPQVRVALRNCGIIDPANVDHYIARGGYSGLSRAVSMTPEQVIDEVKVSGLRGRGGAGFPTGLKWGFCRDAEGSPKYIVCNADEGDPGAFMDRAVIEGDPHSVLEGLIIAAYAIGAAHGYIYVRAEYPLAIQRLENAIAQAEFFGLLGKNVLESDFAFDIKIKKGAGAFVCGEETALLASLEGKRGMPRTRPPFPAQSGFNGKPSNINNVETLANVPVILAEGGKQFAKNGTEKSPGTKTFSLAGKIVRTGLIEVPLGIPLRQIVFEIGGGILDDKPFKAVQTGGPSGGCIPTDLLDLPVDYEHLAEAGAIMGSGGMVVMDETTCMVDIARYFTDFTQSESCGKCVPCRLGTRQMLHVLEDMVNGKGRPEDIDMLEDIAESVNKGSLCALGQTAPNPVLTTIKYFRDEYNSHAEDRSCPAGCCTALLTYSVDPENCTGCGVCLKNCPVDAIEGEKKEPHKIDLDKCISCDTCYQKCKFEAIVRK